MRLFISYAHADKPRVSELISFLNVHEIWIDDRLNIGDHWWDKIEKEISNCHCFVFMLSPQSLASDYCKKELEYALKLNKPIAPIQIVETNELPDRLSQHQFINASHDIQQDTIVQILNQLFEIERLARNPLRSQVVQGDHRSHLNLSDLVFATTNSVKLHDFEAIIGTTIQSSPISTPDIQHLDVGEVALKKAQQIQKILKTPVFVEQSGLAIRSWGGLPGGMTTPFVLPMGLHNVCKMMTVYEDRYARAISVVAFSDGNIIRKFEGVLEGRIADTPRFGDGWHSWGAIFIPENFTETLSEMSPGQAHSIMQRRRAFLQFMQFLKENYEIS